MIMKHSVFIDGGAGRVITAIPALVKFVRKYQNDEVRIFVCGWDSLFWNHPVLQKHVFPIQNKGNWDYIKDSKRWFPEPYHNQYFIDGTCHLIHAFQMELGVIEEEGSMKPDLYVWSQERSKLLPMIQKTKQDSGGKPIVVFQPYGSGMKVEGLKPIDSSNRSIDVDAYLEIVRDLSRDHCIIFMGSKELEHPGDTYTIKVSNMNPDLRFWMTLIEQADYFIGVDSLGQHIAYTFDIPSTVVMGSTREQNVSYPNFNLIRKPNRLPEYAPLRIPGVDYEFAERQNDGIMDFTPTEVQGIIESIRNHVRGK